MERAIFEADPRDARRENLSLSGRQALSVLLKANKRLNVAYVLKESFGQLWDYKRAAWRGSSSTTGARASDGNV